MPDAFQWIVAIIKYGAAAVMVTIVVVMLAGMFFSRPPPEPRQLGSAPSDLEAVAERARALGWKFERTNPVLRDYAITGTLPNGASWKLVYRVDRGESGPRCGLEWSTGSVRAKQTELMIAGKPVYDHRMSLTMRTSMQLTAGVSKMLNKGPESSVSNKWQEDLAEFLGKARDLGMGSARFRERFVVAAPAGTAPRLKLDSELEQLICDWPKVDGVPLDAEQRFAAWLEAIGLRIVCDVEDPPLPIVEHVVRIGVALAARI